jgi:hypothetical protein
VFQMRGWLTYSMARRVSLNEQDRREKIAANSYTLDTATAAA